MLGNRGRVLDVETGDVNNILSPANIYDSDAYRGTYYFNNSSASNTYESSQIINATYLSNELQLLTDLRVILGLRFENFSQKYKGSDFEGNKIDKRTILKNNIFPSANLVYALNDNSNLRTSYAKTIARPSFKESSNAEIYDPTNDTFFIGNLDVQPSFINNFDIRYETFQQQAQMFAISLFYKSFVDPIELGFDAASTSNYKPLNLGNAEVYGIEIELRKKLSFISDNIDFNLNTSFIESKQTYSEDERLLRELGLREGETLSGSRNLQGQSPYLINAGINLKTEKSNINSNISYNVQGKTLEVVGDGFYPDVYTKPFNSLNFTLIKNINSKHTLTFKIKNLLNQKKESLFESYNQKIDVFFSKINQGTEFSLGYALKF